jgi:predicted component of type VI protein secretion system
MPSFQIIVRRCGSSEEPGDRYSFDLSPGEEIHFGRAEKAEITLPQKNVSSRHGRIRCNHSEDLLAYDLGSLNGSYLEGAPLDKEQGTLLYAGAQLRVGDFTLELATSEQGETLRSQQTNDTASILSHTLERCYANLIDQGQTGREIAMRKAVEQSAGQLQPRELAVVLAAILNPGNSHSPLPLAMNAAPPIGMQASQGPSTPSSPKPQAAASSTAPQPANTPSHSGAASATSALQTLSEQLLPESKLDSAADEEIFCQLLHQICTSALRWLAKGLQARGVFAEEFGAEVTLVFQRSANPLKAMSYEELRRYLLDWHGDTDTATRLHYLESVLKDLNEHQIGLVAGIKESVMDVIQKLAPARIEALASEAKGWTKSAKFWACYRQTHEELLQEQSKLFSEMIAPAIQRGYLNKLDADGEPHH